MSALRPFLLRHRARISRIIVVAFVLSVGLLLAREMPRDVDVELLLGARHDQIVEVRIEYLKDGEELHGVALSFPEGAPATVHHSVSLPAGMLEVRAEARGAQGLLASNVATLQTPAEGTVRIQVDAERQSADAR